MATERVPETYETPEKKAPLPSERLALAVYILQAVGFFIGLTFIVGVVINYLKRDDVKGTWLESHFRWQIRTFWFGLLWGVVGALTSVILVGFAILAADVVWLVYRIVKGWLNLRDKKEMYAAA